MKLLFLSISLLTRFVLYSQNDVPSRSIAQNGIIENYGFQNDPMFIDSSEICYCADVFLKMQKEIKGIKDLNYPSNIAASKIADIQAAFADDMEYCRTLDDGKTENEKKSMEIVLKECEAYTELVLLLKTN